jgi:hypothetical protein
MSSFRIAFLALFVSYGQVIFAQPARDTVIERKLHPGSEYFNTISRGQMIDGKWHGKRVDYAKIWVSETDTAWKLIEIAHYNHGIRHGTVFYYNIEDSGQVYKKGQYTNGKRTGLWTEYHSPKIRYYEWGAADTTTYDFDTGITTTYNGGKLECRRERRFFGYREYTYFDSTEAVKTMRKICWRRDKRDSYGCLVPHWLNRFGYRQYGRTRYYNEQGELEKKQRPWFGGPGWWF